MKLAVIAVGQAGGKITDQFIERQNQTGGSAVSDAIAVNSAEADLMGLENIPKEKQVLVGQSEVKGHGVGADNELGAKVMKNDIQEVQSAIDEIPTTDIDAFLIIAALGGGTGSGGAPVIADHLNKIYTEPVYGVGVLPSSNEGSIYTLNAARSLQTVVDKVDNLLVFDNEAWQKSGDSLGDGYAYMNDELVKRLDILFNAGELDAGQEVAESVVDSSEIINTLSGGGISTVGYASEELEQSSGGLLSSLRSSSPEISESDTTNMITSLVRKAALGRLTLPCELDGFSKALIIVGGPANRLNRKGIERSRVWMEEQTGSREVRGGDYPVNSGNIAGLVLLSGVENSERIKELQAVAVEAQSEINEQAPDELDHIEGESDDDLEPLF